MRTLANKNKNMMRACVDLREEGNIKTDRQPNV